MTVTVTSALDVPPPAPVAVIWYVVVSVGHICSMPLGLLGPSGVISTV